MSFQKRIGIIICGLVALSTLAFNTLTVSNVTKRDMEAKGLHRQTKQQCPIGIMKTDGDGINSLRPSKRLKVNMNCPASVELLHLQTQILLKKMTFLVTYRNNNDFLANQVESWRKFSQAVLADVQFVIIDDGSDPGHRAIDLIEANMEIFRSLDIVVYEIDQDLDWNIAGARNLGFWVAATEWVFMNDVNVTVEPKTMDFIHGLMHEAEEAEKRNYSDAQSVYGFFNIKNKKPHEGIMLLRKESFWLAGGFDEDFVGNYGLIDPTFFYRVEHTKSLSTVDLKGGMILQNIPPLVEVKKDEVVCPSRFNCLTPYTGLDPSKDKAANSRLFQSKRKKDDWSKEYLRFTWTRVW